MTATRTRVDQAIDESLQIALPELDQPDRDSALTGEMGLDSVQIMNLVMEIEDQLDISVPVDVLAEVRTLNQLATRLTTLMEESGS